MSHPIPLDVRHPILSWRLKSDDRNVKQASYELTIFEKDGNGERKPYWNSGVVHSEEFHCRYDGPDLKSCTVYIWRLAVTSSLGDTAKGEGIFETAFMERENDWNAKWIEPKQLPAYEEPKETLEGFKGMLTNLDEVKMNPALQVRKEFSLVKDVLSARAYVTAHGVYNMFINGQKIGDTILAPGITAYEKCLEYQTYDITDNLVQGGNALSFLLGDGWYCGKVGMPGGSCQFGNTLALLFEIRIRFTDGTSTSILSDGTCRSNESPIRYSDLFVGEKYDSTLEETDSDVYGFDDSHWFPVKEVDYGYGNLRSPLCRPVSIIETFTPKTISISPKGETIIDAGVNTAGFLRFRVYSEKITTIRIEYSETLDKEGNFFFNIQGKFTHQTDIFITNGKGLQTYQPSFTYHGFRYVRITGYPGFPDTSDFEVCLISSELSETGYFACSDEKINTLQRNIVQSQKSNMVYIPTDCPQREKQGWTGDAQIFLPTACFNRDMESFFSSWLRNMRADQREDGQVPYVIPHIKAYSPGYFPRFDRYTCAGWGDASVIIPWNLYQIYGNKGILEDNYSMMKNWVEYIRQTAETEIPDGISEEEDPERYERMKFLWNTNYQLGDWLTPSLSFNYETGDVDMPKSAVMTRDIVPTCFYAHSVALLEKISHILGYEDENRKYDKLLQKIKKAFSDEFLSDQGILTNELQGLYVLALRFQLIPDELRSKSAGRLVELIRKNGNKLDTGFLSVPYLLDVLVEEDYTDVAFDILFQEECPSWLYAVNKGATSIWESWQAVLSDGTQTSVSQNHYAFGCVGNWLYRKIGGLQILEPGYRTILIEPFLYSRIQWTEIEYESPYGSILFHWNRKDDQVEYQLEIPINTDAVVRFPNTEISEIRERSKPISLNNSFYSIIQTKNYAELKVGSGCYSFSFTINKGHP